MSSFKKSIDILLLFVLTFSMINVSAQEPVRVKTSDNKVIIEGKIYYLHVVKPGQTLYSISKAYDVDTKEIAIENPGVYSGLQIGQILKIPFIEEKKEDPGRETDTTKYIIHYMKSGETFSALSRIYNIPLEEIQKANPDLDYSDISIDQPVLIPKASVVFREDSFRYHKVRRRETIYGITKRYDITEEELKRYNPELQWGGLKTGQMIRIPTQEVIAGKKEDVDEKVIQKTDSLIITPEIDQDSLVRMQISDYYDSLPDYSKRQINVAYLIPFAYYPEKDSVELVPENETIQEAELRRELAILPSSINYLEFFEGSLLALDSLRKAGVNLNVHYFDTRKSPSRMREIMQSDFFMNTDLIIGPFFQWNVEIVNQFSIDRRIPMISPFYSGTDLTEANPYLFQLNPSSETEFKVAAQYIAKNYEDNFIFIYKYDSIDQSEVTYFKERLNEELESYTHLDNVVVKEIAYENAVKADITADLSQALSKDRKNIVIIPETEEAFISTLVTHLYFQLKDFDIELFGMPHWTGYENVDFLYFHKLKLQYITPYYFSYEDEKIKKFLHLFLTNFKSEPSLSTRKGCYYAFAGYDISFFFLDGISRYKKHFIEELEKIPVNTLLPRYDFQKTSSYGGFENNSLMFVKFHDDFSVTTEKAVYRKKERDFPFFWYFQRNRDE